MNYFLSSPKKLLALLQLLISLAVVSCAKDEPEIVGTTESFQITSTIVKDDYTIFVYKPAVYNSSTHN